MEKKNNYSNKTLTLLGIAVLGVGLVWIGATLLGFTRSTTTEDAQVEQYISSINVRVPGYIDEIRTQRRHFACHRQPRI